MRVLFLALVLVVASSAPAWAAVSLVQSPGCVNQSGGTHPALTSAPTNGNIVIGGGLNGGSDSAQTLTDSNSVSYTKEASGSQLTGRGSIWDKVVAGSPTKTYTTSTAGTDLCLYEISGANSTGTFQTATTASGGTTLTATIAGAQAGDFLVCVVYVNSGYASTASNNSTFTEDVTEFGQYHIFHGTATATTSTTCTATMTAGHAAFVLFSAYTAAAVATSAFGLSPNAGVYPGGAP